MMKHKNITAIRKWRISKRSHIFYCVVCGRAYNTWPWSDNCNDYEQSGLCSYDCHEEIKRVLNLDGLNLRGINKSFFKYKLHDTNDISELGLYHHYYLCAKNAKTLLNLKRTIINTKKTMRNEYGTSGTRNKRTKNDERTSN